MRPRTSAPRTEERRALPTRQVVLRAASLAGVAEPDAAGLDSNSGSADLGQDAPLPIGRPVGRRATSVAPRTTRGPATPSAWLRTGRAFALAAALTVAIAARDQGAAGTPADAVWIGVRGAAVVRIELRRADPTSRCETHEIGAPGAWVRLESGPARAYARNDDSLVWPRSAEVRAGGSVEFCGEALRRVEVRRAASDAAAVRVRFIPDRSTAPSGPPDRIDAVQAWIDGAVPRAELGSGAATAVVDLADGAWWVVGSVGTDPVFARLERDATQFVAQPASRRRIVAEPTVAGDPVPKDTLVAPGRLDLAAAASVRALAVMGDFPGAAVRRAGGWTGADIADAGTATLWHPSFGIAYTTWAGDGLRDATPEPGRLAVTMRGGGPFSGHVAVWPAWAGDGRSCFSRPSDRFLRIHVRDRERVVLGGLPPGGYRFDHAAVPAGRTPAVRPSGYGTVVVRAQETTRLVLDPDP